VHTGKHNEKFKKYAFVDRTIQESYIATGKTHV